ncbi:hypothetical protein MBENS4_3584 [Novosphingobium sp. MBES04]|nr:hypothetical protein MBENS4_3584 [Novosphingobium sp. MBES04]
MGGSCVRPRARPSQGVAPLTDGTVYLIHLDRDEAARAPVSLGPN